MPNNNDNFDVDFKKHIAAVVTDADKGGILIRVNPQWTSDLVGRTRPYKNFPYRAKPAMEKVADYVRTEMIPRTFQREGPGWRKLARRTQHERKEQGYNPSHPILIRTRDLYRELTEKGHPKHVEIIKTGKYARIIVGGSSDKFVKNQGGNWMEHIPARPMIPGTEWLRLPERDRRNIHKILEENIRKELNKNA